MKKLIQEVDDEGLTSLMGKRAFIVCSSYFYEGILTGINGECVLLEDAYFVLESGDFTKSEIPNAEKIQSGKIYVMKNMIESFFTSHRK